MSKKRGQYTAEFKARVVLDSLRGDLTLNELSKKYHTHPTQINRWKQQGLLAIKSCFNDKQEKVSPSNQQLVDDLYRQIGQLSCENDFLKKNAWK